MLGRQVGSSLLRLPIHARLLLRPTAPFQSQCPQDLASRTIVLTSQRYYATPGRPRKAVGEPSRPVKRAAKRQAKDTSGTDPATKLVKARKTAAKSTTKKAAPKKTRAKKPLTETQKAAQAAAQEKATLRKDKAKAKRAEEKEKAKTKELRELALSPPTLGRTRTAWAMFLQEKTAGLKEKGGASLMSKQASEEWKSITPAQREVHPPPNQPPSHSLTNPWAPQHYNHLGQSATQTAQASLKAWVESHSPEEIKRANRARSALNRKYAGRKTKRPRVLFPTIPDERAPKRTLSSFMLFNKNRQASGDFKDIAIPERGKLIGREWAALTEGEKKVCQPLHVVDGLLMCAVW